MPTKAIHKLINYMLTGEQGAPILHIIDLPALVLGSRHRILFHDPLQITILSAILSGGDEKEFWRNFIAGHIHLAADVTDTIIKNIIRKITREMRRDTYGKKYRVSNRRNKK